MDFDVILRGGQILDGTGRERFAADVGIKDGRLAAIGDLSQGRAKEELNVSGLFVAPGFIDLHSHGDWSILEGPWDDHRERQGITTELGGNCGSSPVHLDRHFQAVEEKGLATNYALLVGHGSVRKEVMGRENRPPTRDELKAMEYLVAEAMEAGAFGLSTGLIYEPGRYAATEEILYLVKVVRQYGGTYNTHMRSESDTILEALEEAMYISASGDVPLEVSHIKVILPRNWGKGEQMIEMIEAKRRRGLDITADLYPYTVTGGGFYGPANFLPSWKEGGWEGFRAVYDSATGRRALAEQVQGVLMERGGAEYFTVIATENGSASEALGLTLPELADRWGLSPAEALLKLIDAEEGKVVLAFAALNEAELESFLLVPWSMIGTDGTAKSRHPRARGTYPRVLGEYVREKGLLTWEEAVRKMTSLPAQRLGLVDRGIIAEGKWADLTIFDPKTVRDRATYLEPELRPAGIIHVLVNGELVVRDGQSTGKRPGRVLRRGRR